jgi:hypothetical protein
VVVIASGLWRGLGPLVVFAVPKNAVRFFFVEMIRNQLRYCTPGVKGLDVYRAPGANCARSSVMCLLDSLENCVLISPSLGAPLVCRNEKGAISLSGNFFAGLCGGLMEAILVVTPQVD